MLPLQLHAALLSTSWTTSYSSSHAVLTSCSSCLRRISRSSSGTHVHRSSGSGAASQRLRRIHTSSLHRSETTQLFHTPKGRVRIDLSRPNLIGAYQSRGDRPYQEDTFCVQSVNLDKREIYRALASSQAAKEAGIQTPLPNEEDESSPEQAVFAGVFDGHNGSHVSNLLRDSLADRIVQAKQADANDIVTRYRALGGYLRRYKGGVLQDIVDEPPRRANMPQPTASEKAAAQERHSKPWNLHQRIAATYLDVDLEVIATDKDAGSVATAIFLHTLDDPRMPFFSSKLLHLVVAHLGDTRALLCASPDGTAVPLTETHHPEARSETDRLLRTRTGAVTDSFGESRWAGSLANTRGIGDAHYKQLGVFAEPALRSRIIKGDDAAFIVLLSDGVTEQLSDQEICDLVRAEQDPTRAARSVVNFAESIGAQDNLTCIVIPLPGWGSIKSEDSTKARREFRLKNFEGRSNRQNRM